MKQSHVLWVLFGSCAIFLIWFLTPLIVVNLFDPGLLVETQSISGLGTVGDTYGILNSLFTGLALAAIVVAIFIQASQLRSQNENLELYRQEVDKTIGHIEKEDHWNRLRSKIEVLPLLTEIAEEKLRDILGDSVDSDFYKSELKIMRLQMLVAEKIKTTSLEIEMEQERTSGIRKEQEEFRALSEDDQKGEILKQIDSGNLFKGYNANKDAAAKIDSLEERMQQMRDAEELLSEIVGYQRDLRAAYKEARDKAS